MSRFDPPAQDGARTRRIARCAGCWLHVGCCVCAELPRVRVAPRVIVVMHHFEARRSSNTGRLAARVLGADVLLRGLRDPAPRPPLPGGRRLVLFPAPSARVLTPEHADRGPVVLVVPDGNWKQASPTASRDEAASGAEIVALPPGPPSRYRLRRRPSEAALCTYEAIARALAILEAPAVEREMMRGLDLFVERTLALRGGIAAAE
ncbi:MAG: DTW domain-containing protein [Polyangiaceae bacterium]|nr:DTW domain-containing protein [Polyangiaceae bacterium]